jgi:sphinganine-1-phosphate aldolase
VKARGFEVIGAPQLGIVAFTHPEVDGLAILGKLYQRGWVTSAITEPRGLHLMLSPVHLTVADQYLADLDWATQAARGQTGAAANVGYAR